MTAGPQRTVSVALAAYNGERFLAEQLASLAGQTLKPLELVVVDDGSTDATLEIVRQFATNAPFPVRVFRNPARLGYAGNFLRAAELCAGDLIAFCDQDDIWADDKLERTTSAFDDSQVQLAYHNARLITAAGKPRSYIFNPNQKSATLTHEDIEPWRIVPGFAQVIRRSLLAHTGLHAESLDMFSLDEPMPHDQWFLFLATVLGKVACLAEPLASYRQHDRNTSGWLPAKPLAFVLHNVAYASYYVRASHNALQNRIGLLQKLKAAAPASEAGKIDAVIAYYTHVSSYVQRRLDLYTEKSLRVRLRLLLSMARGRTYSDAKVRFDRGSMLLDTLIGVPFGKTLR